MDEIKEIENLIDNEIEELNKTVDTFDEVQFFQDDLKELIKASSLKDLLLELDKKYPEYGFSSHKGYPTKKHLEAIEKYGIFDEYRKTYGPVKNIIEKQGNLN